MSKRTVNTDAAAPAPATKLSVEYLSNLSPKSLRKVPPSAFPKTKGISLEESQLPPYNKLERYVQPKEEEEVRIEDVWFEEDNNNRNYEHDNYNKDCNKK